MQPELRPIDHLIKVAAKNLEHAAHYEPRMLWDVADMAAADVVYEGSGDALVNVERYPILIKHLVIASVTPGADPRLLSRVGMRLHFRDHDYMGRQFAPLPMWQNELAAGSAAETFSAAHQVFDRPVILSQRDAMQVQVESVLAPTARRYSVTFKGVGMKSFRPYVLTDTLDVTAVGEKTFSTAKLRNDGSEDIALTDWSVHVSGEEASVASYGDIRYMRVTARLLGNGTRTDWMRGPATSSSISYTKMPAVLAGVTQGQCIVHHFPCDGVRLEPGQGMGLEFKAFDSNGVNVSVGVALHGYIQIR